MLRILIGALLVLLSINGAYASCYDVRMISRFPGSWAGVDFSDGQFVGDNSTSPASKYCKRLPEKGVFIYSLEAPKVGVKPLTNELPAVLIRQNMPKKFMSNPARLLYLELTEDKQPLVLFNMKLSEVTTKLIPHDETLAEKQQRLKDERLYLGIKNNNSNEVKAALASGASVIQPWIEHIGDVEDRRNVWAIYDFAMGTNNPEIIDAVLDYKAPFRERPDKSAVYHDYRKLVPKKFKYYDGYDYDPKYVTPEIADILLSHGANPNYGLSIYFNWNKDPELEKRPDMPRFARYKDAPIDRLIYTAVSQNNIELVKVLLKHNVETHYKLPATRTPPDWWKEGEWFLDWAKREASPEIKAILFSKK